MPPWSNFELPWRRRKPTPAIATSLVNPLRTALFHHRQSSVFEHGYFRLARSLDNLPLPPSQSPDDPSTPPRSSSPQPGAPMPYVTPTTVLPLVIPHPTVNVPAHASFLTLSPATPPVKQSSNLSTTMVRSSSKDFAYESNQSANPLPGLPRSRNGSKIQLVTPCSSRQASRLDDVQSTAVPISSTPDSGSVPVPVLSVPTPQTSAPMLFKPASGTGSPTKSKRVRGQRTTTFTTSVPSESDDESDTAREDSAKLLSKFPSDTATVGRKRGDMLRHTIPSLSTPNSSASSSLSSVPTISTIPTSPESRSPMLSQPSLISTLPSVGGAAPITRHQAVVAGQGNVLRLNMDAIKRARSISPSTATADSTPGSSYLSPATGDNKYHTVGPSVTFVRKKSGELVKPALRNSRALSSTAVDSSPTTVTTPGSSCSMMFRRNSAPTTPTPKNVHFDAQLEHVKLFLAEQKPAAVSRDGSPTGYGSTTEEETYPWHAFPRRGSPSTASAALSDEEERLRGKLVICVKDAQSCGCETATEAKGPYAKVLDQHPDVGIKLESLVLAEDGKGIKGNVAVKNIAYDKRVTARFTFDWWSTTSEVVGRYVEGVSRPPLPVPSTFGWGSHNPPETHYSSTHDRFTFFIKLGDILPKIDEKTMFLALRYNVAGQEMWDNNRGQNYQVTFERVKPSTGRGRLAPESAPTTSLPSQPRAGSPTKRSESPTKEWSPTKANISDQMAELRKELERVVYEDGDEEDIDSRLRKPMFKRDATGSIGAKKAKTGSSSPPKPSNSSSDPPTLSSQLSSRYDLNASLRSKSWNPSKTLQDSWNPPALPASEMVYPRTMKKVAVAPTTPVKPESSSSTPPSTPGSIPFPSRRTGSESPDETNFVHASRKPVLLPPSSSKSGSPPRPEPLKFGSSKVANPSVSASRALGSPRDREDGYLDDQLAASRLAGVDLNGDPIDNQATVRRGRNHQRGSSYFDGWMGAAGCVKRTPPGTPREVQEERMQRIETSKCEENEVEAVLTGSSRPVLGLGPITVAEDAIMDTEDEDDEKEQEKEVLGILGITPSSSANDLATSASTTPTAASTRPSPSTPSVVRFNSFPVDWHVHHISPAKGFPMAPASDASGLRSLPASLTNRSAEGSSLSPVDRSFVSTPSVTSASSPSQSPSSPLHSLPMSPSEDLDVGSLLAFHSSPRGREMMDSARYNFFLDRFCFWTGDSTSTGPNNSPGHRRIHSESEVDTYFAVHNHVRETSSGLHSLEYQPSSSFTSWMSGWGGSGTGVGSGQVTPTKGVTTPRPGTPSTLLDSTMATPVR